MLPFRLKPFVKTTVWGGHNIASFKQSADFTGKIGESWEVSAMPGCESVIESGEAAGMPLSQACKKFGARLLGDDVVKRFGTEFPILIKFIDAADDLSVQVHPDEETARKHHSQSGKNEFWYIVRAETGARVISGFKAPLSIEEFDRYVSDGNILDVLAVHETHPGDTFFIPPGRVHAACRGNLILEVQQPSDVTYRIFDYGRLDSDGLPRPLHLDLARATVDLNSAGHLCVQPQGEFLIDTPYFKVIKKTVSLESPLAIADDNFTVAVVVAGNLKGECGTETTELPCGTSYFIPACARTLLTGDGEVILVKV